MAVCVEDDTVQTRQICKRFAAAKASNHDVAPSYSKPKPKPGLNNSPESFYARQRSEKEIANLNGHRCELAKNKKFDHTGPNVVPIKRTKVPLITQVWPFAVAT
jgi:hypothetical protein